LDLNWYRCKCKAYINRFDEAKTAVEVVMRLKNPLYILGYPQIYKLTMVKNLQIQFSLDFATQKNTLIHGKPGHLQSQG